MRPNKVDRTVGLENKVTQLGFGLPDMDIEPELAYLFVLSAKVANFLIGKLGGTITSSLHLLLPKNYVKVKATTFKAAQSGTVEKRIRVKRHSTKASQPCSEVPHNEWPVVIYLNGEAGDLKLNQSEPEIGEREPMSQLLLRRSGVGANQAQVSNCCSTREPKLDISKCLAWMNQKDHGPNAIRRNYYHLPLWSSARNHSRSQEPKFAPYPNYKYAEERKLESAPTEEKDLRYFVLEILKSRKQYWEGVVSTSMPWNQKQISATATL